MKDGFLRVAAATPEIRVADPETNRERIAALIREAAREGCGAVCFPELCLTGYTCGDLFKDRTLIRAAEEALRELMEETKDLDLLCAVGVPVPMGAPFITAPLCSTGESFWAYRQRRTSPITPNFTRPGTSPPGSRGQKGAGP